MASRLFKEHPTANGQLCIFYILGARSLRENIRVSWSVPKNDLFEENILQSTFSRFGPNKFSWVRVLESSSIYDNNHDIWHIWQDDGKIFNIVALLFKSNLPFRDDVSVRTWCSTACNNFHVDFNNPAGFTLTLWESDKRMHYFGVSRRRFFSLVQIGGPPVTIASPYWHRKCFVLQLNLPTLHSFCTKL